jgi:hypothetical protein
VRLYKSDGAVWERDDLHARLDILYYTFIWYCKNIKDEILIFMVNCLENVNKEVCFKFTKLLHH